MNHDELTQLDAAYVLGALEPDEERAFEEHLRSCPSCARAVREVREMPRLLGQVDEAVFRSGEAELRVPDTLLPGLLREVRRRRRRRLTWLAAAAAAVVVTAGGVAVWTAAEGPEEARSAVSGEPSPAPSEGPEQPAPEPMDQVGQDVVSATLAMEQVPWGTRMELRCSYDAPAGGYRDEDGAPSYSLAVRTRDGAWEQVATWRAVPGRTITVTAATAVGADDIASVEVRSTSGRAVLELDS